MLTDFALKRWLTCGIWQNVIADNGQSGPTVDQNSWDGRTIEVSGIEPTTTDDAIEMFFESKRRSGGGTIEHVHRDKNNCVAHVTFEDKKGQY